MSALRQLLSRPELYLLLLGTLAVLFVIDAARAPGDQVSAALWLRAVDLYQERGRDLLADDVRCRFRPSCSVYSERAVHDHGIVRGLVLTMRRLSSCTRDVPMGTVDPVPAAPPMEDNGS